MANYLWEYNLGGGIAPRQFTNTYGTSVQQNATYDPSLAPDAPIPPYVPHVPPPIPAIDGDFKVRPLKESSLAGPYRWFQPTPRDPAKAGTYPPAATPYADPSIVVSSSELGDYDGGLFQCKLWHPYEGGPIIPDGNYGNELEYPDHDFWNEFKSVPSHTLSVQQEIATLLYWYPLTEFITLRPRVFLLVGHAMWSCENPDDGYFAHPEDMPDSPQTAVNHWDWYSYTDYQPFRVNPTQGDMSEGRENDGSLCDIARHAAGANFSADTFYVEPESTIQRPLEPDYNSTTSNHYILHSAPAHTWNNQNPANNANRIMWEPSEVNTVQWSARGGWGHVTVLNFSVLIEAWVGAGSSARWMAVL